MKHFGKRIAAVMLAASLGILSACGGASLDKVTTTTLQVNSDGSMKEALVDSTQGSDYTTEDVKTFVEKDLENFKTGSSEHTDVSMDAVNVDTKAETVRIDISYGSCNDYKDYHNTDCFYGAFTDAQSAGYDFATDLQDNSGEVAALATIEANNDSWNVLIVEEKMDVITPDDILYASTNVTITGKRTATVVASEENSDAVTIGALAYIICK